MQNVLRADGSVGDDGWVLVPRDEAPPPGGDVLLPVAAWLAGREAVRAAGDRRIGAWLSGDEDPEALRGTLDEAALVAVNFPVFSDGRGYSVARILRERIGWRGELRAVGDVLRDQVFLMRRCGFDSFAIRPDRPAAGAAAALEDFRHAYQQATVDPGPALLRRGT